jgi:hypothetical protein
VDRALAALWGGSSASRAPGVDREENFFSREAGSQSRLRGEKKTIEGKGWPVVALEGPVGSLGRAT